ncbi:hypothetical protein A3F34_02495 [Candidatus Roizmanbacteria bacterium RIFCSPHIGHO2_12_FULL_44_10]|uniref:Uncharacterized protein n=1 Tax=Candidatus Roizmanbacteria bacterium RIFCSPHIGHO2_12_FULL_44_10 TaxID=1802054 RepID=A0A1F7I856_9BACT|nr:MAG: hypothetical protein A3F34_02495 [Candidatus Roizmanbacteria bacterium RIFCSPHIGHO2_12_FULL_44_10]
MPRKTKKQKKLADLHRVQISYIPPSAIDSGTINPVIVASAKKQKTRYVTNYEESNYDKVLRQHVKTDMKKTILIIVTLFILQLVVFYLYNSGRLFSIS